MITPPFPAKPYFTPKKEKTINNTFKTELEATNFAPERLRVKGTFIKYKIGIKEMLIRKKRQNIMISIERSKVRIFSALQPPPHKNIAKIRR
jgi:hypothetical protein